MYRGVVDATPSLVAVAAAPTIEIIRGIAPDQLDAPTPCSEYDVGGLINHLLFWGTVVGRWGTQAGTATYDMVAKSAEQGREMGVYGPEFPLPETASLPDRILGLTGRDPNWAPDRPAGAGHGPSGREPSRQPN